MNRSIEQCEKETLNDVEKALKDWYLCFFSWAIVHYTLGITSSIGAVLVASSIEIQHKDYISVYVAVATAILTFLKAQQKSNSYVLAWRNLRAERMKYYAGSSSLEKLAKVYTDGESNVGRHD